MRVVHARVVSAENCHVSAPTSPHSWENALRTVRQELNTPELAIIKLKHDGELSLAPVVDPLLGHCDPDEARKARYCSGSSWHFLNQLILGRTACSEDIGSWETGLNNLAVATQIPRCVCCRAAAEGEAQNNQFVLHHFKFRQRGRPLYPFSGDLLLGELLQHLLQRHLPGMNTIEKGLHQLPILRRYDGFGELLGLFVSHDYWLGTRV